MTRNILVIRKFGILTIYMNEQELSHKMSVYATSIFIIILLLIALYFYGAIVTEKNQYRIPIVTPSTAGIQSNYQNDQLDFISEPDEVENADEASELTPTASEPESSPEPAENEPLDEAENYYNPNAASALWAN